MMSDDLKRLARGLPNGLEVIVRCEWEGDTPNGPCFRLASVLLDVNHTTDAPFVALDCDQQEDQA